MEVVGHVQNTRNRKLVLFLQYIKKKVRNCIEHCDAKYSIILWGTVMFVVTCFTDVSSLTGCIGLWASSLGCWEVRNVINFDRQVKYMHY